MKGHPGAKIRAISWTLAGLFFAVDLATWGGLATMPKLGDDLRHDASLHSPLAATYLAAGKFLVEEAGQVEFARDFATRRFVSLPAPDQTDRQHALEDVLSAQFTLGTYSYYGAPLLGLLSLVLHLTREKPIRSFGRRG